VQGAPPKPRTARKVDAAYLERAGLYYLERFSTSSENFRRVLKRKIDRRCKLRGESPEQFYPLIAPLVERYQQSGLLDDTRYAEAKVASLRRKGLSKRMIQAKLKEKGIESDIIENGIAADDTSEMDAALNLVRRKKLGKVAEKHNRDLGALARAGFSYAIAKRALKEAQ